MVIDKTAGRFLEGQVTLGSTAVPLVATPLVGERAKRVKLMVPVDATGTGSNTGALFYGSSDGQYDWLAVDGSRDDYIHIDDPYKIIVRGTSGDKVNYRIEF